MSMTRRVTELESPTLPVNPQKPWETLMPSNPNVETLIGGTQMIHSPNSFKSVVPEQMRECLPIPTKNTFPDWEEYRDDLLVGPLAMHPRALRRYVQSAVVWILSKHRLVGSKPTQTLEEPAAWIVAKTQLRQIAKAPPADRRALEEKLLFVTENGPDKIEDHE